MKNFLIIFLLCVKLDFYIDGRELLSGVNGPDFYSCTIQFSAGNLIESFEGKGSLRFSPKKVKKIVPSDLFLPGNTRNRVYVIKTSIVFLINKLILCKYIARSVKNDTLLFRPDWASSGLLKVKKNKKNVIKLSYQEKTN